MIEESSKGRGSDREHEERKVAEVKEYHVSLSAKTEHQQQTGLPKNLQDRFMETVSESWVSYSLLHAKHLSLDHRKKT